MITTVNINPSQMSLSEEYSDYADSFGMYQMCLDNIHEEAEIFQLFAKHDIAEMACVDEAAVISLNEMTIKDIKNKIVSILKAFVEKIKQIVSRFISTMAARIDMWGKMADRCEKIAKDPEWGKNQKSITGSAFSVQQYIKYEKEGTDFKGFSNDIYTNDKYAEEWFYNKFHIKPDDSLSEMFSNELIKKDIQLQTTSENIKKLCFALSKISLSIKGSNNRIKEAIGIQNTLIRDFNLNKTEDISSANKDQRKDLKQSDKIKKYSIAITNINKMASLYTQYMVACMNACVKGGNVTAKTLKELIKAGKGKASSDDNSKKEETVGNAEEKKNEGGILSMFDLQMFDEDGWAADDDMSSAGDVGDTTDTNDVYAGDDDTGFGGAAPDPDAQFEAAMKFWNSPILEADADEVIEPGDPVDNQTKMPVNAEDDFYATDPENHKEIDDFMKNDDSTEEVQIEAFFADNDLC